MHGPRPYSNSQVDSKVTKQCVIGVKIQNQCAHTHYEIIFTNCVFIGFDHAVVASNTLNTLVSMHNCMFKGQSSESVLCLNLDKLQIKESVFKKCGLQLQSTETTRACISVRYQNE
jgi:hypothetical protein